MQGSAPCAACHTMLRTPAGRTLERPRAQSPPSDLADPAPNSLPGTWFRHSLHERLQGIHLSPKVLPEALKTYSSMARVPSLLNLALHSLVLLPKGTITHLCSVQASYLHAPCCSYCVTPRASNCWLNCASALREPALALLAELPDWPSALCSLSDSLSSTCESLLSLNLCGHRPLPQSQVWGRQAPQPREHVPCGDGIGLRSGPQLLQPRF